MVRNITLLARPLGVLVLLGTIAGCGPYEGDDAGECEDGADNDRDGAFDCDDPDCDTAPSCAGGDDDDLGDDDDDNGDDDAGDDGEAVDDDQNE